MSIENNVINIEELAKNFKTIKELRAYCNGQYTTIQNLQTENNKIKAELIHLKQLLTSTTLLIEDKKTETIIICKEEALIDGQIDILNNRALGKELSLDDVKKLDILMKHKNLFKDKKHALDGKPKKPDFSDAQLLEFAIKPVDNV